MLKANDTLSTSPGQKYCLTRFLSFDSCQRLRTRSIARTRTPVPFTRQANARVHSRQRVTRPISSFGLTSPPIASNVTGSIAVLPHSVHLTTKSRHSINYILLLFNALRVVLFLKRNLEQVTDSFSTIVQRQFGNIINIKLFTTSRA